MEETYSLVEGHFPGIDVETLRSGTFSDCPNIVIRSKQDAVDEVRRNSQQLEGLRSVYAANPDVRAIVLSGNISRRRLDYAGIELTVFWTSIPGAMV